MDGLVQSSLVGICRPGLTKRQGLALNLLMSRLVSNVCEYILVNDPGDLLQKISLLIRFIVLDFSKS